MDVVDDDEHGAPVCGRGEQAECRGCDGEAVCSRRWADRERPGERRSLALRNLGQLIEHGPKKLRQAGEGDLGLRLDPACGEHVVLSGRGNRILQQGGFPDSGFAAQEEPSAATVLRSFEELVDRRALGGPAEEFERHALCGHRLTKTRDSPVAIPDDVSASFAT